jgi:hypothetical protein
MYAAPLAQVTTSRPSSKRAARANTANATTALLAEWQAAHTARLEQEEAEDRREAEMVQRMCEAARAGHAARL